MDFLYNFSNLSIMFSFIFMIGLLLTILHFIARSVPFLRPRPETFDFAMRMQIPVFSMCGLLLAFSLVNVQGNLKRVDALVTAEAAQLNNLDRLLSRARVRVEVRVDPSRLRATPIPRVAGDASRLRARGWTPRHALDEALDGVLQEQRALTAVR